MSARGGGRDGLALEPLLWKQLQGAMAKIFSVPVIVAALVCHLSTSHPGGYSVVIIEAKCRFSDSQ